MKTRQIITAVALLALPALAEAQTATRVEGSATAQARGTGQGGGSAAAALSATAAAGLPQAPVRSTIAEGEARGASREAVGRAAMRSYLRLQTARGALTGDQDRPRRPSDAEIVAGAEALAAGSTEAELRELRDAAPPQRDMTASLHALAELRARGMGGAEAASALAAQLRAGASDGAITALAAGADSLAELRAGVAGAGAAADAAAGIGGVIGGAGASLGVAAGVSAVVGGIVR